MFRFPKRKPSIKINKPTIRFTPENQLTAGGGVLEQMLDTLRKMHEFDKRHLEFLQEQERRGDPFAAFINGAGGQYRPGPGLEIHSRQSTTDRTL